MISRLIARDPSIDAAFRELFFPASEAPARAEMRARIAEMIANDRCEIIPCPHGLVTECAACIAETEGM